MYRVSLSLICACLLLTSITFAESASAEWKIATVDVNKVLNESKEAQASKKQLDAMQSEATKKLESQRTALKKTEADLQKRNVDQSAPEFEAFRVKAREFARQVKDTEDELKKKFLTANRDVTQKALVRIENYAKKEKIDLVLDKSAEHRGPVLFGTPGVDITGEIIKELNS